MDSRTIAGIMWPVIIFLVLPVLSLYIIEKVFRMRKTKKRVWLYDAAIVAALLAWPLSQIFVPLSYIGTPLVMFLALFHIAKMPPIKSLVAAIVFSLTFLALTIAGALVIFSIIGFS